MLFVHFSDKILIGIRPTARGGLLPTVWSGLVFAAAVRKLWSGLVFAATFHTLRSGIVVVAALPRRFWYVIPMVFNFVNIKL